MRFQYRKALANVVKATLPAALVLYALTLPTHAQGQPTQSRGLGLNGSINSLPSKAKRWALIIGVDQYKDGQISTLKGSANDARSLANALVRYAGFPADQVILLATDQPEERQPTRVNVLRRLSNLASVVPKDGLLLVSFAGHGMERNGQAYLLPSDAQISNDVTFLEETALSVTRIKERIRATSVGQVIVLLDACRNDPGGRADAPNPLTQAYTKFNFDVRNREVQAFATLYATAVGQRAYEYSEKRQGYFTWAMVEGLKGGAANEKGEVTLSQLVKYIQEIVPKRIGIDIGAGKQQRPFAMIEGYKAEELVIAVAGAATPAASTTTDATTTPDPANMEISFWESIKNSTDAADFQAYLDKFPNGTFAALARRRAQPSAPTDSTGSTPATSVPRSTGTVAEMLAQAEIDYQDKDYNKVITTSGDILSAQPDNARANLLLGLSYLGTNKYANSANYLSKAIALGEKVSFPIKHHHHVFLVGDNLCSGYVSFGKNGFEFHSTSVSGHDFTVPSSRVYELVAEGLRGGRLRVKIGLQKETKEERKTYNFHSAKATVVKSPGKSLTEVSCDDCLGEIQSMSQLFQQLIRASETKEPVTATATTTASAQNQSASGQPAESSTKEGGDTNDRDKVLRELLDIEQQGVEAFNRGDKAAYSALLADDFTLVENGKTYDRAKVLSAVKQPKYPLSVSYESVSLSFQGEVAVLDGISVARAQNPSAMVTVRYKFTDQFVKRDGRWLIRNAQIEKLK
jgi:ketosteroid isomerase-like protein